MQECLFESGRELYHEGFILQQDNATPHTSKSTKNFLELHGIKALKWPPNSPDLNPIENLWAIMKREVEKCNDPTRRYYKLRERPGIVTPFFVKSAEFQVPETHQVRAIEPEGGG